MAAAEALRLVTSGAQARDFVRDFGPLVILEPEDGVYAQPLASLNAAARGVRAVWKAYRAADRKTIALWRETYAAHLKAVAATGERDTPLPRLTEHDFPVVVDTQPAPAEEHGTPFPDESALLARSELQARLGNAAAAYARYARINARVAVEASTMVVRPLDLISAVWLALGERIAVGDASIECRSALCRNIVRRELGKGTMQRVYCGRRGQACKHEAERGHDRYPRLTALKGRELVNAIKALRSPEIL